MIDLNDIYYLSDQFGSKFIKVISIGDIWEKNDNWVYFYRSVYLDNILKAKPPYLDSGCFKSQIKKVHFERLLTNITYSGKFRGCIKIPNDILISREKCLSTPYMCLSDDKIICKEVSKEDYRNLKLNKLLE
jgi:hypothetical protein